MIVNILTWTTLTYSHVGLMTVFIALFVQKDILFYSDLIKTLWLFYTKKNDVIVKIIVS